MTITYGVTVCNELVEIKRLLTLLKSHKKEGDVIMVLMDSEGKSREVETYLEQEVLQDTVQLIEYPLNNNFANFKNKLIEEATTDYLFQLDADEIPSKTLLDNVHELLEKNPQRYLYALPRVNTVEGITTEHIRKWGWNVDVNGYINFPDFQLRLFRLNQNIRWEGNVHEVPGKEGILPTKLPCTDATWALFHPKTIEKQEKQNEKYSKMV